MVAIALPPKTAKDAAASDTEEEHQPPLQMAGNERIRGTESLCRRFIFYNVRENIFVVTAKYKCPIVLIRRGDHAIVCSALNSETNKHVAIKKIPYPFGNEIAAKRMLRQVTVLVHMDHKNIVAIKDIIPPVSRESMADVNIVFQLMDTDLEQVLRSNQALSKENHKYLLYQLLCGLKYMSSANILHRNLKPSNILVNKNFDLKICGFQYCGLISEEMDFIVSISYCAPEVLLAACQYTAGIDIWSVGCIFMELVNRERLFHSKDVLHQIRMIVELLGNPTETDMEILNELATEHMRKLPNLPGQSLSARFPNVDPLAIDLVEKILTFDPRRRITVEDALAHPYLKGLHYIKKEPVCPTPISFDFEKKKLNEEQMKELLYEEALELNPELQYESE